MPERVRYRPRGLGARTFALSVIAPVVVLLVVSACGDDESSGDGDAADLAGTSWTLASASSDGDETAAVASATLAFGADGESITGSTGCNQFSGTYTQDGDELTISLGPMTLAACTDPALTAQETAILANLPEVVSFSGDDQLVLENDSGDTLLVYDAGMTTIGGTSWTATGINNGNGGVESTTATGTVTAEFGAEGALTGFSGCNTYNATYTVSDGGEISITAVSSTLMACDDAAMTLESQYLAALGKATTFELSGDTLTLRDGSGATQVAFALAA